MVRDSVTQNVPVSDIVAGKQINGLEQLVVEDLRNLHEFALLSAFVYEGGKEDRSHGA